jgi:antitoxin component YwqK of YwqJK toxin-antitoxin module
MKRLIFILFCFQSTFLFSQIKEAFITDASLVEWYFDNTLEDTIFCLKDKQTREKWIVYYDPSKKQKAFETEKVYYDPSFEYRRQSVSWHKDGTMKSKEYMDGDTAIWLHYYPNGQIKRIYKNLWGRPEYNELGNYTWIVLTEQKYYKNGQIKQTPIDFKSKDNCTRVQPLTFYFENGLPSCQLNWLCGALVGEFKEYYENGKLKTFGHYTTDVNKDPSQPLQNGGVENGEWKYYNEKGKLLKTETYDQGKLIRTTKK